jgi:hypothetical protein
VAPMFDDRRLVAAFALAALVLTLSMVGVALA